MSLLVLVTGLGLAAYTTYWLLYEIFFNPLRKIPGPFLARFTILWEVWTLYQGSYLQDLLKLHEKHGMILSAYRSQCAVRHGLLTDNSYR